MNIFGKHKPDSDGIIDPRRGGGLFGPPMSIPRGVFGVVIFGGFGTLTAIELVNILMVYEWSVPCCAAILIKTGVVVGCLAGVVFVLTQWMRIRPCSRVVKATKAVLIFSVVLIVAGALITVIAVVSLVLFK